MHILISILAFLVLLSFLVLIHEFGHFFAARKAKVIVEEFGFGLPPRLKTLFFQGGTRFSLNWVPFGGFVRLKGENAVERAERTAPGSFARASVLQRVVILTAGVFMNFLFAIIIFTLGFSLWGWIPTYVSVEQMRAAGESGEISFQAGVLLTDVQEGGTAADAKVPVPSILEKVDGYAVYTPQDVVELQKGKAQVIYELVDAQGKNPQTVTVPVRDGKTGVGVQFSPRVSGRNHPLIRSFVLSLREAKVMTVQTVMGMAQLFRSLASSGRVPEGITGIVGIYQLTQNSVASGFMEYLRLMAVLSLSLAILNVLPFPALDGGRLVFVLAEAIARRPMPRRFELTTNMIGFVFLILLILIITYHDILRLF